MLLWLGFLKVSCVDSLDHEGSDSLHGLISSWVHRNCELWGLMEGLWRVCLVPYLCFFLVSASCPPQTEKICLTTISSPPRSVSLPTGPEATEPSDHGLKYLNHEQKLFSQTFWHNSEKLSLWKQNKQTTFKVSLVSITCTETIVYKLRVLPVYHELCNGKPRGYGVNGQPGAKLGEEHGLPRTWKTK